jgi:O-antigen ligase
MLIIATKLYTDKRLLDKFLKAVVFLAITSGVYGIRANNVFNYKLGYVAGGTRQMASFNDPNYASCFINMAIFITFIKIHKKAAKLFILAALYVFLVAAGSMTGFLLNAAGLVVFSLLYYRKKAVIAIVVLSVVAGGAITAVTKIPALYNTTAVQTIMTRISYQYTDVSGDKEETLDTMTSGRSGQWKKYMEYFNSQDISKRLFGGNVLTTTTMDPYFTEQYGHGPHEAYISFAVNFGIVGLIIIMLAFATKLAALFFKAVTQRDENELALFMTSFTWFVYGLALDYFFDTRFMTFFFL